MISQKKKRAMPTKVPLRKLLMEQYYRLQVPILRYKPGEIQLACFKSQARYRMMHGVNQGGKTTHACAELTHYMNGTHPYRPNMRDARFLVMAPKKEQVRDVWGKYLLEQCEFYGNPADPCYSKPFLNLDDVDLIYDQTTKPYTIKMITHKITGNSIQFGWSAAGGAQLGLEGKKFDGVFLDESAGTQVLIDEIYPRLMVSATQRPGGGFILWGSTETTVSIPQANFLKNCLNPNLIEYESFRALETENLGSVSIEVRRSTAQGMSKSAGDIRMRGTGSAMGDLLIYPILEQRRERYIRSTAYEYDNTDNIYVSYDQGIDHPCGLLVAVMNKNSPRKMVLTNCLIESGTTIGSHMEWLKEVLAGRKITGFVYDQHGNKRDLGTGLTSMQQVYKLLDYPELWIEGSPNFIKPKQSHPHGIAAVREQLDPPAHVYFEPMIEFDLPTPDNGINLCFEQCSMYRGREDKNFTGPQGVVKINDEGADIVRYLAVCNFEWENHGFNGFEKRVTHPTANRPITALEVEELNEAEQLKIRRKRDSAAVAQRFSAWGRRG